MGFPFATLDGPSGKILDGEMRREKNPDKHIFSDNSDLTLCCIPHVLGTDWCFNFQCSILLVLLCPVCYFLLLVLKVRMHSNKTVQCDRISNSLTQGSSPVAKSSSPAVLSRQQETWTAAGLLVSKTGNNNIFAINSSTRKARDSYKPICL